MADVNMSFLTRFIVTIRTNKKTKWLNSIKPLSNKHRCNHGKTFFKSTNCTNKTFGQHFIIIITF